MTKGRVLLIASQSKEIEKLSRIVEEGGYQVATAADGDEAVRLSEERLPEVALLEIQSPDLDGLQILQRLKKRGTTRNLPVVLLLDKFDEDHVAHGLEAGAADYLLKPFGQKEVLRRVGVWARIRQHERHRRGMFARYEKLFHGEEHGMYLSTRDGRFLDVNEALVRLFGYDSKEELLGKDIARDVYWDPQDRKRFQEVIEGQGVIDNFKVQFKRKDGEKITILINGHVVRDERGAIIGYEGTNIDISEQTGLQEERRGEQAETKWGKGRFLQRLIPRYFPFSDELLSFMKMTELIAERYEKVEQLGLGRFGEIWKVRDSEEREIRKYYVAKIPRSKKLNRQIEKEGAICRRLRGHPNAVKVVDLVEDRGRMILVQEFVEGITLKELMERPLEQIEKESIVLQLVDIVAYAHRQRIIHRDIKPENILIGRNGTVKLLDFGVAKELKDEDISSTMVGSRPFMAPEQIMGESQIASDVWALGVIIYGIYTEYLPFYHDNEKVLMDLILTQEPEAPREIEPEIPVELEEIILKCLKKDPKERFANAGALREALLEKFPHFGKR